MIVVDMSNLAISAIQEACSGDMNTFELTDTSVRHVVIKKLIDIHKKIGSHHELILACDSKNYWRKDYLWCYKSNRVKIDSKFSWEEFYRIYSEIKKELPIWFGIKVIEVERVEGDDIINCIADHVKGKNYIIVSADTDDLQIQERWPEVTQYSLKVKKFITCADYKYTLLEHIIEGDKGDGIPSILSPEDIFTIDGSRQPRLTKKIRANCILAIPPEYQARFDQNKMVVDMSMIPDEYRQRIIEEYEKPLPPKAGTRFKYCMKFGLSKLMKFIT